MRNYFVFALLGFVLSSFYILNEVNANSEFFVYNKKGSYNLGCELDNSCFEPYFVKIEVGDTVTWINNDDAIHVVISGNLNDGSDGFFDSGSLKTNETFSFTFDKEGNYEYFCILHPWMIGFVTVGNVDFQEPEIKIFDNRNFKFVSNPVVLDSDFKIQEFVSGLIVPVNMVFLGEDLLVIEKNSGAVRHIKNNKLLDSPVLDVEVSNYGEQGLLGITSVENEVYLFFTEAFHDGGLTLENRVYKYIWNGNELVQPILLKRIPVFETIYVGGELVSGLDGTVYAVTGENYKVGLLQNHLKNESYRYGLEGSSHTILDGLKTAISCVKMSFYHYTTNPVGWQSEQPDLSNNPLEFNLSNILGNLDSCVRQFYYDSFSDGHWKDTSSIIQIEPKDEYAAIGIRNSFGLAVDPKTGYLWDTENGPDVYDEINLVETKFNSGWAKIQGPSNGKLLPQLPNYEEYEYSEPEFSWELPIGVTAIEFPNSKMFEKYENFVFVADVNNGNIYKFKLDDTRTKFIFESPYLQDNVLNILENSEDAAFSGDIGCLMSGVPCYGFDPMDEILFGKNFGMISDMKFGPDGALYVISLMEGKIYRITT